MIAWLKDLNAKERNTMGQSTTTESQFLAALDVARHRVRERMELLAQGEQLFGTRRELEYFLSDFDRTEREVMAGYFSDPKESRRLSSAHIVGDQWPFDDPVADAVARAGAICRNL